MKQIEKNYSIGELKELFNSGKLNLYLRGNEESIVSRGEVWDLEKKSYFILSVLKENIIPQIYIYKDNNENLFVIDGRQRLYTLFKYIDNKFAVKEEVIQEPFEYLKNRPFNQLDTSVKNKILNFNMKVIEQTGTLEESLETFYYLNNGVSLKPIELFKSKIGVHLNLLDKIANHNIFELIGIKKDNMFVKYDMALYFLMLESNPGIGLSKREKEEYIQSLSKIKKISESIEINLFKRLDYLFEAFNTYEYNTIPNADKYLKRSHIIIIYKFVKRAIEQGIKPRGFFNWCNKFFYLNKNPRDNYWIESSRGSTTSKNSMNIKYECLRDSYLLHFEVAPSQNVQTSFIYGVVD